FLSCGDVFSDGVRNAAIDLGISFQDAYWDDPGLPLKIREFEPDWLFVIHGRRYVEKWRGYFPAIRKAVWLLDEPYEVDDTSSWSGEFDAVFLNDPSTIDRHRNAHYLPVGYDPTLYFDDNEARKYDVGFVGGHNESRERYLLALNEAGLLSYVVGGPWKSPALREKCLAPNIAASATADLYRQTRIVVNLFRQVHHFNRENIAPYSMNPRVYEGLGCGAVVVSEARDEIAKVFPEVPQFSNAAEMVETIGKLRHNDEAYDAVRRACCERVQSHSYSDRLRRVLATLNSQFMAESVDLNIREILMASESCGPITPTSQWGSCGGAVEPIGENTFVFNKATDQGAGTEQGLASIDAYSDVELNFEVKVDKDACFLAKVRQADRLDQTSNSYHLYFHPSRAYLARHNHLLQTVRLRRDDWQRIKLSAHDNRIEIEVNGELAARAFDRQLASGYCFVGS
ncbi:MAG: CgeB family protein, partial [Pyrinomonadaceae bacterium]